MKIKLKYTVLRLMLALACVPLDIVAEVVPFPFPGEFYRTMHNDDFTVTVRPVGQREWTDLFECNVKVDMDTKSDASFVQFDFDGKVEVCIQKNNGDLNAVVIRPLARNIRPKVKGNIIRFILDKPQDLTVECNGDRLHNLHIFTNPLEGKRPARDDKHVMYFGEGLHEPEDKDRKEWKIPSNTTVYLEPGAVLKGRLSCDSVENVKIVGRGCLLAPPQGFSITYSKNIRIEGVTVINPEHYTVWGGQSQDITIKRLRSFSYQEWCDGIDMMSCHDVHIDSVFLRNSDDCLAFYNHRAQYYGGTSNVTVENSVLWADVAHPINIGGHGNAFADPGETMEKVTMRNIDVLEHDEDASAYHGCIAVDAGDRNLVRNVLFENIRVESIQEGCLIYVKVRFNQHYDKQPGRGVENVVFRDIFYNGPNETPSVLMGYDTDRVVKEITFDNVRVNGRKIKSLESFQTNAFVKDIHFK